MQPSLSWSRIPPSQRFGSSPAGLWPASHRPSEPAHEITLRTRRSGTVRPHRRPGTRAGKPRHRRQQPTAQRPAREGSERLRGGVRLCRPPPGLRCLPCRNSYRATVPGTPRRCPQRGHTPRHRPNPRQQRGEGTQNTSRNQYWRGTDQERAQPLNTGARDSTGQPGALTSLLPQDESTAARIIPMPRTRSFRGKAAGR